MQRVDEGYRAPAGVGEAEHIEKRSRFLARVSPVTSEEDARALIARVKAQHHDARHNCWCYLLRGGVERYSDDGEPQGTAGVPMLELFRREGVTDLCCVVTRYFGGILLGAGGLVRAYSKAAKDALTAAGVDTLRPWTLVEVVCPYPILEQLKREVQYAAGTVDEVTYAEQVTLRAALPDERVEEFSARVTELTAGGCLPTPVGKMYRAEGDAEKIF